MPLLKVEDLRRMNAVEPQRCDTCGQAVRQNYCRTHDVFFWAGHMKGCEENTPAWHGDHAEHRTY